MPTNITFRTQLLGGVTEFCQACRLPTFTNSIHLIELIVLLAKYKEEGVPLYPEVYITSDIVGVIAMLPEAERLPLGIASKNVDGIRRAIKKSAPLATGGWLIFIEDANDSINYGLFRGSNNPISVLVDKVILDPNNLIPVTKIFQVAEDCVEIVNCSGERHFIFLNHRKEDSPPPLESLEKLIDAVSMRVSNDLREPTQSFLTRVLYNALRVSHGTIIAVTDKSTPPSRIFDDGVKLDAPIDFPDLIRKVDRSEISSDRLASTSSLLEGMLNSDGIILFDNHARILGFNYFVRSASVSKVIGGARRRAFEALTSKFGKGVCGAFIQSQDGWSEFKGVPA